MAERTERAVHVGNREIKKNRPALQRGTARETKNDVVIIFARLLEGLGMVLAYTLAAAFAGAVLLLIVCIITEMDKEANKNG